MSGYFHSLRIKDVKTFLLHSQQISEAQSNEFQWKFYLLKMKYSKHKMNIPAIDLKNKLRKQNCWNQVAFL